MLDNAARACAGFVVLLVAATLPARASAAPLPLAATAVISGTPDLAGLLATPVANSFAGPRAVSNDGTVVAFSSQSDGLVPGADPDVENVFVKNLVTGQVILASRADGPDGEPSHSNCNEPALSADGRSVAFVCEGSLDPADTNNAQDVYVRNISRDRTVLASRLPGGAVGNRDSQQPSLDADGKRVAFATSSTNLGDGADPNTALSRVYLRDVADDGAPFLVSRADGANGASIESGASSDPSVNNDATVVAFDTTAGVDGADDNGKTDVYVRDLGAKTTKLVSRETGAAGKVGNGDSQNPLISDDGTVIAFNSTAGNFDTVHDGNADNDVYARDTTSSSTRLVSQTNQGVKGNRASFLTGIDGVGDRIAFLTESNNLDAADLGSRGDDVYVSSQQGLTLASRGAGAGTPALGTAATGALSADGDTVAMTLERAATGDVQPDTVTVAVRRLDTGTLVAASRPGGSAPFVNDGGSGFGSSVSADGRYVAFASDARGLGLPSGAGRGIFVRDTVTGAVALVSRQDGQNGAAMAGSPFDPKISADGRRVVFGLNEGNEAVDSIWLRDIPSGRTYRIDRADGPNGAASNGASFEPTISDDGSRVEFLTTASNLGDGDTDGQVDSHVRDIDAGTTLLASRASGVRGAKANAPTANAQISGNGRRVAFSTDATNLDDGDGSPNRDIHVRDLESGQTLFASFLPGVSKGDGNSDLPSISANGNRVGFVSNGSFGFDPPGQKLYVRDLIKGSVILAGRADGPNGAPVLPGSFEEAQISDDGNAVAFVADPQNTIAPDAPSDGSFQAYARDLVTGATRLVSRAGGADGAPVAARVFVTLDSLTADGGCVTFTAEGRLIPPPASADYEQVYMRVLKPDCGGRAKGPSVLTPGGPDRTAPRISKAKLSRKRFRVGAKPTALRARARARVGTGTVLSLRVSEAATLTVTVDGRRVVHRKGRARRVFRREGTLVRALKAGSARIPFSGRLGKRRLPVGRHRLVLVARDAAGNVSRRVVLQFTVVR